MQACKKGKVELLVSVFSHKEGLGLDFMDERGQVVSLKFFMKQNLNNFLVQTIQVDSVARCRQ